MTGRVHEADAHPVAGLRTLGESTYAGENHGVLLGQVLIDI